MKSLARRNIAYRNCVLMYRAGSGEHGSALLQVRVVPAAMPRRLSLMLLCRDLQDLRLAVKYSGELGRKEDRLNFYRQVPFSLV